MKSTFSKSLLIVVLFAFNFNLGIYAQDDLIRTFEGHTSDVWSVVFSPDGSKLASGSKDFTIKLWRVTLTTSVEERYNKSKAEIINIYPNLINEYAEIVYYLDKSARVTLSLHSVLGEEVIKLEESIYKDAGQYSIELNTFWLSSGTYYLVLKADGETYLAKVCVVK